MSKARSSSSRIIMLACALLLSSSAVNLLRAQQKAPCHFDIGNCERDTPAHIKQVPPPIPTGDTTKGGKQIKRRRTTGESGEVAAAIDSGNQYYEKKDYAQARLHYQRALGLKPGRANRAVAYYMLSLTYYAQELYAQAIPSFQQAIKLEPQNAETFYWLGNTFYAVRRYVEATEQYKQAITLNPDFLEAYYYMANIYYEHQRYADAISLYKQVLRLATDKDQLAVTNFNIANAYYAQRLDSEAVEYFNQAIFYRPGDAQARFYLGYTYLALKRYPEAIEQYKRIISLNPEKNTLSSAHTELARTYVVQGRYQEAAAQLEQAIQLRPENFDAHFGLGVAYLMQGNKDRAMEQYRLLLKLKPDWAKELLARINVRK
jgi:tetratricopeptide (TPR) repeat protein